MSKKNVFVPKPGTHHNRSGIPKALLGRIFIALSIGVVFLVVLSLIWRQNAQPPIGDTKDAGKPKVFREIPKTTLPEPQVLSLDKASPHEPSGTYVKHAVPVFESKPLGAPAPSEPTPPLENPPETASEKSVTQTDSGSSAPAGITKTPNLPSTMSSESQKLSTSQITPSSWVYAVQVGAYSKKENAQEAVERLKKMGLPSQITPISHPKLGALYAVRAAPFNTQEEAQKAAEKIARVEKEKPFIVKVPAIR
ncbi:SPOR domain-containing protein [Desulfosoma caldarium]|uniref:Cell division septation protein DedD n=1 Tax=Desulfosoma caldarium TaxID=610254 RepID=A0A3N1UEG2_9BACT|nr:SPOR domain-containing protein [Desulfosoma caldarium]ROQ89795.1 cell division septation protein DedD [Desulfosoma caldarium]